MKSCIKNGWLSIETLKDRACRMLCFVREYFERHPVGEKLPIDSVRAENVARQISERAIKLVRDRASRIPFNIGKETRIANVVINNVWADTSLADELGLKLANIASRVETYRDIGPAALLSLAKGGEYDLIVCSVFESPSWGINTSKLCGPAARNMMNDWMRYNTPVIFVSYNSESFGETYKASVDTLIETYGITKYTADRVIKLICGE